MLCLLAACTSEADRKLEATKGAHSVIAEWALVERLNGGARLEGRYVSTMRHAAADELRSLRGTFAPQDEQARLIDAALAAPTAGRLLAAGERLGELENELESR